MIQIWTELPSPKTKSTDIHAVEEDAESVEMNDKETTGSSEITHLQGIDSTSQPSDREPTQSAYQVNTGFDTVEQDSPNTELKSLGYNIIDN